MKAKPVRQVKSVQAKPFSQLKPYLLSPLMGQVGWVIYVMTSATLG